MDVLITSLMTYIALVSGGFSEELNYDSKLKSPRYLPIVKFADTNKLHLMKYNRPFEQGSNFKIKALYLNGGTIYLEKSWDINNPADQSVLLHELVHYMQEMNFLEYECEGNKERLAYYIQEQWLMEKHNLVLYDAIGLNPLAMVFAMSCPAKKSLAKPWEGGA